MLSRLVVKGFKSFADPTTLRLRPGVNVIVGPNGSGKSNLAEAILWALGEQRAGRLRAGGMGDVLYAGGERRPAAPLAEVTLILGADGDDAQPAEIEASRRLTRAGDALYRLGGGAVRLLDVQEALAARGLGPDALAVIRQGQVEALCTSTPEQRRAMVDAAAGVAVAKRRRRRSEQKLARVDERLVRARDLAGEVNSRVQALARQARSAERAAALDAEIAAAERAVSATRAREAAEAHARATAAFAEAARIAGEASADLEAARARRSAAEAARATAGEVVRDAGERAAMLRGAAERVAGRVELARERVATAEREATRRAERREAARARLGGLRDALDAADAELAAASADAERAAASAAEAEAADMSARAARRGADDAASAAAAALAAGDRALEAAERAARTAGESHERATRALEALGRAGELDGARARAERREEVSAGRRERWSARADDAARAAADAAALRAAADERVRQARAAARALAPTDAARSGPATLGDGLDVEPGAERAVAAALGARLDAVVAGSVDEARSALDGGAPCAVIAVADTGAGEAALPGAVPVWGLVRDCPDAARAHLRRLLADTWLVDDIAAPPPGCTGTVVSRDGVARDLRAGLVSRAGEEWARRALHRRARDAERVAEAEAVEAAARTADAAATHAAVARRARAAERCAARAATAVARARAEADRRADELARARAELERRAADGEATGRAVLAARDERAQAAERATAAADAARAARQAGEAAAAAHRTCSVASADARAAVAGAKARRAEAEARLTAVAAVAEEPAAARGGVDDARRAVAALEAVAAALTPAAAAAAATRDELARAAAGSDATLAAARAYAEEAEAVAARAAQAAHAAELDAAVAGERAAEAGTPPPPEEELPDPAAAAEALEGLTRRRAAIGAVNPLAAAEREELAEREAEMHEQIRDLEETAARLRAHMSELDAAVAEGFDSLFRSLCDRFEEVCGLLFPGGRGRLRAVRDEEGEAGIEIEVVPAGKRPRSLALLSGGERSLVALAFCLALAMARPAPFYLLDEVEAALDDVNLRRFLGVVRRLADGGRQFVLITHQQPTVEIADTLFGVTMGAEGVSQVLARRLDRAREGDAGDAGDARGHLRAISGGRGA